jgi:hypothetical protein
VKRDAPQIGNRAAADLGEANTEEDLVAGGALLHLQHVDDFVGLVDVAAGDDERLVEDSLFDTRPERTIPLPLLWASIDSPGNSRFICSLRVARSRCTTTS